MEITKYFEEENEKAAPMLDLLIDQCDHLEELMGLMRRQLEAMRSDDAGAVSDISLEQNELGKKLAISQQQIDRKMI
jgi:hypothetical protein